MDLTLFYSFCISTSTACENQIIYHCLFLDTQTGVQDFSFECEIHFSHQPSVIRLALCGYSMKAGSKNRYNPCWSFKSIAQGWKTNGWNSNHSLFVMVVQCWRALDHFRYFPLKSSLPSPQCLLCRNDMKSPSTVLKLHRKAVWPLQLQYGAWALWIPWNWIPPS